MKEVTIPKATAKRLPLYYRSLKSLLDSGKTKVSSVELGEAVKIDSATIRRDFSYFGELGKRGYGYDVQRLIDFFSKTLHEDTLTNVALVGVGNLGRALINYRFQQSDSIRIGAAFDIKEDIVGRILDGVPVYHLDDMVQQIKEQHIEVAILTVPAKYAQENANQLISADIRGIMNFTPIQLNVPSHVHIQNVDLTNEMQTLIYFLSHYENDSNN